MIGARIALAAFAVAVALAAGCGGGDGDSGGASYDASQVIAIVQGWPLLHANDYRCGTAVIPERTILSVVARREHLDFEEVCGPDDDGTGATRAIRLARSDASWSAVQDGDSRWVVSLAPGTGRTYEWVFREDGPQLLATGGDAQLWPLFNWVGGP